MEGEGGEERGGVRAGICIGERRGVLFSFFQFKFQVSVY